MHPLVNDTAIFLYIAFRCLLSSDVSSFLPYLSYYTHHLYKGGYDDE